MKYQICVQQNLQKVTSQAYRIETMEHHTRVPFAIHILTSQSDLPLTFFIYSFIINYYHGAWLEQCCNLATARAYQNNFK